MDDDWPTCDAEAAVAALSARYLALFRPYTDALMTVLTAARAPCQA
jgi:hypothetical protein